VLNIIFDGIGNRIWNKDKDKIDLQRIVELC